MGIKKGDLVELELPSVGSMSKSEIQEELFSDLKLLRPGDYLIAVTAPYERELPMVHQTSTRGRMFIVNSIMVCVDLLLENKIYKAVPIKYLKRAK